jgi:hypothetical protein
MTRSCSSPRVRRPRSEVAAPCSPCPGRTCVTPTDRRESAERKLSLWGGRFAGGPADALAALSKSTHFDWRLARLRHRRVAGPRPVLARRGPARRRDPARPCSTASTNSKPMSSRASSSRRGRRGRAHRAGAGPDRARRRRRRRPAARRPLPQRPDRDPLPDVPARPGPHDLGRTRARRRRCPCWRRRIATSGWRCRAAPTSSTPSRCCSATTCSRTPGRCCAMSSASRLGPRADRSPYGSGASRRLLARPRPEAVAAESRLLGVGRELHRRHCQRDFAPSSPSSPR